MAQQQSNSKIKQFILPTRMRQKITSSGKIYYYYDTCTTPRKWLALGSDYLIALKKYADLEIEYNSEITNKINQATTFRYIANRYIKEIIPKKRPRTQHDNMRELEKLLEFFDSPPAPIDEIKPVHIREYLDWRSKTAKVRANREISLFSHIFNKAREWGYTSNENPCRGISRNKETGRDVYISDELFFKVYAKADRHIQFVMLIAYLIGQRPADCLKIELSDIQNDELHITQNKVQKKLRIKVIGQLKKVTEQLIKERGKQTHNKLFVYMGTKTKCFGQPLTPHMLRSGMDKARAAAGVDKQLFQFRDLRAKAATDKDESLGIEAARELLGHNTQNMTKHYVRNRKGKLVEPTKI